ncbi:DNA repair protein UVH3 isoform X1 [Dendrobium catenatum]|uniref:DNA repair protein UVH3 isoform X1 n=1 Tax=Dendrobium catenatum TaxID=906689 RepID=UPI0009F35872|nr:DNA repair protein UVH3 isoform X1 [Dendrobium catenatum]
MGVQGLWELLAPVGRRVSVETLSGKKLAIDASIWMIQFMKAMRDERGEMVRNAHTLGFFRRICKLLFLRTKPVFVFDGGTPALKRRTVAARRRHRENARAKIRKTAEKLLLNHLKSKRLEELAEEIKRGKCEINGDLKGKQVAFMDDGSLGSGKASSFGRSSQEFDKTINQEKLDELLAASISAENEAKLAVNEPMPTEDFKYEEEGEEDDLEGIIFPVNSGNIDPAVLASLPPSMQLDLLDQMRERLMADNRQKYQKIKKVPAKFSELQIQSYLKTVAFRREIDEVQKCSSGRGFGDLQTSRIASEPNREYIFSSCFTGDKEMLATTGAAKNGDIVNQEMRTTASDTSKRKFFMSPSKFSGDITSNAVAGELSQDVETYLDDRGRVRVSRVRGLGIRMTRDLQRNLDMMKEHEKVFPNKDFNKITEPISYNDASDFSEGHPQTDGIPIHSLVNEKNSHRISRSIPGEGICEETKRNTVKSTTVAGKKTAIEISFSEDEIGTKTIDDNFFMNLVSENRATELSYESLSLEKNMDDFEPEGIWEYGTVDEQGVSFKGDDNQSSFVESKGCEEDEVMWEEGASLVSHSEESEQAVSLGFLEEEADLKEAIRRSLEDIKSKQSLSVVPIVENMRRTGDDKKSLISVKNDLNIEFPIERNQLQSVLMDLEEKECFHGSNAHQIIVSSDEILSTSVPVGRFDGESTLKVDKNNLAVCSNDVGSSHDIQDREQSINLSSQENLCMIDSKLVADEPNLGKNDDRHTPEIYPNINFENPYSRFDTGLVDAPSNSAAFLSTDSSGIRSSITSDSSAMHVIDFSKINSTEKGAVDELQKMADNEVYKHSAEGLSFSEEASMQEGDKIAASKSNLHDEIFLLEQERAFLGDEQRKLERNAESVSSEMFAECQELLQMFGLPYIIAPMEAEAQCAYMEMNNLVDGIVTDDSDVFLFGGRNVYKNIFDHRKYVETYFMKDIEKELGLSRDKLIRIALLLGSDYTEGVSGIGIVNAIEVINGFPEPDGLLKFKEWVESPDLSILCGSQYSGNLNKKSSNTNGNTTDGMGTNILCSESKESILGADQSSDSTIPDTKNKVTFMDKHRNVSKNWHFPPSFPSESVITAYTSPQIDDSTEPFAWGKPDLPLLRKICWEKFGWPNQKADDLLVPVLKEYNKHETQLRMEAFYSFNERFAKIRSQRIKKALKGITGTSLSGLTDIADGGSSSQKKSGITLRNNEQSELENDNDRPTTSERKPANKSGIKARSQTSSLVSEESFKRGGVNVERAQIVNATVRGRGKVLGIARGSRRGKCKGGAHLNEKLTESSDDEMYRSGMNVVSMPEMRMSTRHRKQVNYAEDTAEINELHAPDKASNEAALEHDEVVLKTNTFGINADSFKEKISQDHLHNAGGFCLEENEIQEEQPLPSPIGWKHSFEQNDGDSQGPIEDGNSCNFLVTGGFCMDEGDPDVPAAAESFQGELNDHSIALKSNLGNSGQRDSWKEHQEVAYENLLLFENLGREQTSGDGSAENFLSAMPSLKRKRKK